MSKQYWKELRVVRVLRMIRQTHVRILRVTLNLLWHVQNTWTCEQLTYQIMEYQDLDDDFKQGFADMKFLPDTDIRYFII